MLNKKTISPVVATALLLVVAVSAVIGFQNFFGSFSGGLFSNVEEEKVFENQIKFEFLSTQSVYIKSTLNEGLISFKISDSTNNILCEIKDDTKSQIISDTKLLLTFDSLKKNGTHVFDLSGYGHNGTLFGNVNCSAEGINGQACDFDGLSNTSIEINITSINNNNNTITFCAWLKPRTNLNTKYIYKYSGFVILINESNYLISSIRNQTIWHGLYSNVTLNNNSWNFICINYDVILGRKMYINGALVGNSSPFGNIYLGPTEYQTLGSHWSPKTEVFNGSIDEVAIYSKVLTQNEVLALYNLEKAKFYEEILPIGVKEINISNCNLTRGEKYNLVAFTNNQKIEQSLIAK